MSTQHRFPSGENRTDTLMTSGQKFYFPHVVPRHLRHDTEKFAECLVFGGPKVWANAVQESYREIKRRVKRKNKKRP
jgi:hypothetical protein